MSKINKNTHRSSRLKNIVRTPLSIPSSLNDSSNNKIPIKSILNPLRALDTPITGPVAVFPQVNIFGFATTISNDLVTEKNSNINYLTSLKDNYSDSTIKPIYQYVC